VATAVDAPPTPAEVATAMIAVDAPPTRIARPPEMKDRPFSPPQVMPIPKAPEPGMVNYGRYAVAFARARWQRRRAVKLLQGEIKADTDALDVVLGTLGREARAAQLDNRVLATENQSITDAERKKAEIGGHIGELEQRRAEETARFEELEREKSARLAEVERELGIGERELEEIEGERRGLKDRRKDVERRQKAYHQAADQRDAEAGNSPLGEARSELRRLAEGHRAEAAGLEPEKADYDRKLAALERPLASAQSKVASIRAEVDQARRSLHDAREGHRHRLAELEAELGRRHRERDHTEAEIGRRLVTLGTLINLHRVERPEFTDLYHRIDRLRSAISARTGEIDHLTAEKDAYDRGSLMRGYAVLGGVAVGIVTLIAIIIAIV
jgi:chromosome segregation ATPase